MDPIQIHRRKIRLWLTDTDPNRERENTNCQQHDVPSNNERCSKRAEVHVIFPAPQSSLSTSSIIVAHPVMRADNDQFICRHIDTQT